MRIWISDLVIGLEQLLLYPKIADINTRWRISLANQCMLYISLFGRRTLQDPSQYLYASYVLIGSRLTIYMLLPYPLTV